MGEGYALQGLSSAVEPLDDSDLIAIKQFRYGRWLELAKVSRGTLLDGIPFPVSSVFGRTGDVVAADGDYTASQVTNVPAGGIAGATVQAALNELDTEKLSVSASANPSASVGLSAVNGVATTYMRSDAAPALDQAIAPTWTGTHTFNKPSGTSTVVYIDADGAAQFTSLELQHGGVAKGNLYWDQTSTQMWMGADANAPLILKANALERGRLYPDGGLKLSGTAGIPGATLVGNPLPVYSKFECNTVAVQAQEIEFGGLFGITTDLGSTAIDPNDGAKVALGAGVVGNNGSFNIWALNTVTILSAGNTTNQGAWGIEVDVNNDAQHMGDTPGIGGLGTPLCWGIDIVGYSTKRVTAAININSTNIAMWNRGIVFGANGTVQADIESHSSAVRFARIDGTHDTVIDATGCTIGSYFLNSINFTVDADGDLVAKSIAAGAGGFTGGSWLANVIAGQYGGTGVANTGKTITLGGNLTTSGAFATTLTATNTTNVTLPTAGTLIGTNAVSNDLVTNALLANMATATFKGRTTAGTGDPEDLSVSQAQALLFPAWTTITPTISAGSGSFTSASATGALFTIGKTTFFRATVTITTNGTAAGFTRVNLTGAPTPITPQAIRVMEESPSQIEGVGRVQDPGGGGASVFFNKYDNTYLGGDGFTIRISGCYESA